MQNQEEEEIEYKTSPEIKGLITKEFLQLFKNKLDEVFELNAGGSGTQVTEEKHTYANTYAHIESTQGWAKAFRAACDECALSELLAYYNEMNWYDSDIFDGSISQLLIDNTIIEEGEI